MCGGRALFPVAQALQELSHDQVSLFSTTKAHAESSAPAPASRDSDCSRSPFPSASPSVTPRTVVPGTCQHRLAQALCGHRHPEPSSHFPGCWTQILSFNSSFRGGFLLIFSSRPLCIDKNKWNLWGLNHSRIFLLRSSCHTFSRQQAFSSIITEKRHMKKLNCCLHHPSRLEKPSLCTLKTQQQLTKTNM